MTKQPLGKKALLKTVLDVLLEAKNVRISYVYEYQLVTWLVTWLHGYKISQRYVENSEFYVWLNFRIPRNFGPPHLHVSGGSEDRGITQ